MGSKFYAGVEAQKWVVHMSFPLLPDGPTANVEMIYFNKL
jgi:hypothetical protein